MEVRERERSAGERPRGGKHMNPQKPTLDELVREAKETSPPDVDWAKVEAKLFPRFEREASARAARAKYGGGQARLWAGVALAMGIAATIPLFFARGSAVSFENARAVDVAHEASGEKAGSLEWKDHAAVAHVTRDEASLLKARWWGSRSRAEAIKSTCKGGERRSGGSRRRARSTGRPTMGRSWSFARRERR